MLPEKAKALRLKLSTILPFLDEKQRRLLVATEAKAYGTKGVHFLSLITGISRPTIYRGLSELESNDIAEGTRKKGGGRKKIKDTTSGMIEFLEDLIAPSTRGDPESPLKWTCKSVRNLTSELNEKGFSVGRQTVANMLHEMDYSLQANKKTSEGKDNHPDRDAQFQYINQQVKKTFDDKTPAISVDTKKKELVGNYKNQGQEWEPKGSPKEVLMHDFIDPKVAKAVPYGVYDINDNTGWVNVGTSSDTAEFAVESINQWWIKIGKKKYPKSQELLICADSGGSNGYRLHLWKHELQNFCNREKIRVTVCHFPPGTSKWNKIEHRLFSYITKNWRGRPLTSYRTVVNLIAATNTQSGLIVKSRLDKKQYKKGRKITKKEIEEIEIHRHVFHGEWNYTISPKKIKL